MNAQAARAYLSIGEVLALLRGEFPDVTISKIRFLEGEGLIEPQRTPSGYRKFTHADVERLRYILTEQRDRYLPLRVIKDHLESAESPALRPRVVPDGAGADGPAAVEVRLTRAELLVAAGLDEETLTELEDFGLLSPSPGVRHRGRYDSDALAVARSVGALAGFGLHARHLRAVKTAVEREASLVEQAVAPLLHRRAPGALEQADETAREISGLLLTLHAALLHGRVRNVSGR